MPSAVLTPFTRGPSTRTGNLWRKRVLPIGDIDYKGRMLHFTRGYNDSLAQAFRERAYDQVPFQLADGGNTHTNDPERFRGDVVDMESAADGLWITLAPTAAGEQVILENPDLGVSARIVEDYARSDGQHYPAAIQHVLGTLDPRIPGLGAWQAIEAANDTDTVLDLSGYTFTGEPAGGAPMPPTDDQANRLAQLMELPADQLEALLSSVQGAGSGSGDGDSEPTDDELAELIASLPEEELAAMEREFQAELQGAGAATGLTAEGAMALEMANFQAEENSRQLSVIRQQLDESHYQQERAKIASDMGIPPYIVDMARPLLEGSGKTVELANGQLADAGQIMRGVLTEFGRAAKMLDLGIEMGSPLDGDAQQQQARTVRDDIVNRMRAQTGL